MKKILFLFFITLFIISVKLEITSIFYIKESNNCMTILDYTTFNLLNKNEQYIDGVYIFNGAGYDLSQTDKYVYLHPPSYSFDAMESSIFFKWENDNLNIIKTITIPDSNSKSDIVLVNDFDLNNLTEYVTINKYGNISISALLVNKKECIYVTLKDDNLISEKHEIILGENILEFYFFNYYLFSYNYD